MSTPFHSQYWATNLSLKGTAGGIDSLSRSIANARVDLNPHQVDAALFALRSPFSKGAILADEVGLGKTIEAGIVLAQRWAERRRKILIIVPATLRKQWQMELQDKFFLPSVVLEARSFNLAKKAGQANPFSQDERIVICSYQFAAGKAADLRQVCWDLVVIDEAHRLRNVFKKDNKIARKIADCLGGVPKLLLTATPLQNNIMELFGLAGIIDEHVFGDEESFREQFSRIDDDKARYALLRQRLKPICTRTLRKQVIEYVKFTARLSITQDFTPSKDEQDLYEKVSAYLQRETLIALPSGQRKLMTMVLRKLLASSTFAISGTLNRLVARLNELKGCDASEAVEEVVTEDYENLPEQKEDWQNDGEPVPEAAGAGPSVHNIDDELRELKAYAYLAQTISGNAKGDALLAALPLAFQQAEALGARRKAVVFTESRRTQQFLFDLLAANGYADKLVMLNGSNTDPLSKSVYEQWLKRNAGKTIVSGSKAVDVKAAIVEEFKDRASILIATEAAAEGVNLQFCSLVVNYDLPWNPQRIEQRIGRCHRYGQQSDVVVVNFLNRKNEADQRVFQILAEKFRLFDGVFGASDEVFGAIEAGVDLEKRIADVYQSCRTVKEIQDAFDKLQAELEEQIQSRMAETRKALLDNFDEEVHARLRVHKESAETQISERERWLLNLAKQELMAEAKFDKEMSRFQYIGPNAPLGFYHLDWKWAELQGDTFFRPDHPLAIRIIQQALSRKLPVSTVQFDYKAHGAKIAILETLIGKSGWLELSKLAVSSLSDDEYTILAAISDEGEVLDDELCRKMLNLPGRIVESKVAQAQQEALASIRHDEAAKRVQAVESRNLNFFNEEVDKLERWSDDLKLTLEQEIKALDQRLKEVRKASQSVVSLTEKLAAQKELRTLDTQRSEKRKQLYVEQDSVDRQRDGLIAQVEGRLKRSETVTPVFVIRWTLT